MGLRDGKKNRTRLEEGVVKNEFGLDKFNLRYLLDIQVEKLTRLYKFGTAGDKCS